MKYSFTAKIYKTGINWCVDVPKKITRQLAAVKGYIKIKGKINGFAFKKSLVPVKHSPYRLFVNQEMMKGGKTALGKTARFVIEQDHDKADSEYPVPELLAEHLEKNGLTASFESLAPSRKKDILRYLNYIKREETLLKNIGKLITRLKEEKKNARIP